MYNKVFLIGNLTRDPEVRFTNSGIPVARFAVAVNRPTSKKGDGGQNEVDFINIVAWRRLAEICRDYMKKGRPIAIEGSLQIRKYEKDGEKRSFTEVVADNIQMLGRREDQGKAGPAEEVKTPAAAPEIKEDDQEVPF